MSEVKDQTKVQPIPSIVMEDSVIERGILGGRLDIPENAYECVISNLEPVRKINRFTKKSEMGAQCEFKIIDGPYAGNVFTQFFTNKLTKKSKLSVLVRGIWGRDLEPTEMAQLEKVSDLQRFLLNKPVMVIILLRVSMITETVWYDIAFFLKSKFYDEAVNQKILSKEDVVEEASNE